MFKWISILLLIIVLNIRVDLFAQLDSNTSSAPNITQCLTDHLNFGTGLDEKSGMPLNFGSNDAEWVVVNTPPSFYVTPYAATVRIPDNTWMNITPAQWIHAPVPIIPSSAYATIQYPYVFETCFCVESDYSEFEFTLTYLSAQNMELFLIDNATDNIIYDFGNNFSFPDPSVIPMTSSANIILNKGQYCLRTNLYSSDTFNNGFVLDGFVQSLNGLNLVIEDCCETKADCLHSLIFNETFIPGGYHQAESFIRASGFIDDDNYIVDFKAGEIIELTEPFTAESGSELSLDINECDTFTHFNFCDFDAPVQFNIIGQTASSVILEWNDVPGVNNYIIEYVANDSVFIEDYIVSGTMATIPLDISFTKHEYTIFTICPDVNQIGMPQGPTVRIYTDSSLPIDCFPPFNLSSTVDQNTIALNWETDSTDYAEYFVTVIENGQDIGTFSAGTMNNFDFQAVTGEAINYEFIVFGICPNGYMTYALSTIVLVEIDLPDSIERICNARCDRDAIYNLLGSVDELGIFDCLHYGSITYNEWIKCHCEPTAKKAKKTLPLSCP